MSPRKIAFSVTDDALLEVGCPTSRRFCETWGISADTTLQESIVPSIRVPPLTKNVKDGAPKMHPLCPFRELHSQAQMWATRRVYDQCRF